jgi:hypothetical protein
MEVGHQSGQYSRFLPSNRVYCGFSPRNCRFAEKTASQIKPLPENSRSSANREFSPAEPGLKVPEPGIIVMNVPASASFHQHRPQQENDEQTHLSAPLKPLKHRSG